MFRLGWIVLAVVLAVVMSGTAAQDKAQPGGPGGEGKKLKGRIPLGWSKLLKLTDQQKKDIRAVDLKGQKDAAPLLEQVQAIRLKARQEMLRVLTLEQRKTLAESVLPEGKVEKKPKE